MALVWVGHGGRAGQVGGARVSPRRWRGVEAAEAELHGSVRGWRRLHAPVA
jgi:hypothetical protein